MNATRAEPATAMELWNRRVIESGREIAFRYKQQGLWHAMTWSEADAAAREIAAGLVAAGVEPGDRVCLLCQTRVEWILADVGILLAAAVTVPIYASSNAEQCAFIIRDAGARTVIVEDAAQLEKIISLGPATPAALRVVHIAGDAELEKPDPRGRQQIRLHEVLPQGGGANVQSLGDLRQSGRRWLAETDDRDDALDQRLAAVGPESTFTIIYTSGTTGDPKGVVLSHRNLTAAVGSACRALSVRSDDEQLLFLPLAHVLGRELAWAAVWIGFSTWFAESIAKLKDNLLETRPTFLAAVPRVFEKLHAAVQARFGQGSPTRQKLVAWALAVGGAAAAAEREGRPLGLTLSAERLLARALVFSKLRRALGLDRCRFLFSGGAPLAAEIGEFFARAEILILEGYGLTETMAAAFVNRLDDPRFGTVGTALDVVEAKIAEDGEILMRGPSIFSRYHDNPAATAEAVDAEGWFHSGDIGQLEDGFLRITDRKKDLIVTSGGKKIAPQPIENALKVRCPLLGQVVVFGDRRPYCVALFTPSEKALRQFGGAPSTTTGGGGALDVTALRAALETEVAAVNAGLAPYETIKAFAVLPEDFTEAAGEMTPSMKVKRKAVAEKYRDAIEGLYK